MISKETFIDIMEDFKRRQERFAAFEDSFDSFNDGMTVYLPEKINCDDFITLLVAATTGEESHQVWDDIITFCFTCEFGKIPFRFGIVGGDSYEITNFGDFYEFLTGNREAWENFKVKKN